MTVRTTGTSGQHQALPCPYGQQLLLPGLAARQVRVRAFQKRAPTRRPSELSGLRAIRAPAHGGRQYRGQERRTLRSWWCTGQR